MKIPGYTIIRELGSGGMATVYLARQDRLTREVALKVMKPAAIAGDDFTSRFIKEGQIIAQLQHPQIVTIHDFDSTDGYHYFSMEYLPGGTLADEIKKGIATARALGITKKIAEALAIAHARGVIHRDIKPQNILFRGDGTPVLTDFGIARAVTRDADSMQLTSYGMVIGSPRYMSPEQSTGQPLDPRSDLYSLGVVFHEMLTNRLPYEADDVVSLAMKHCSEPIPQLAEPLVPYQPILDRLIAKKPTDRFASAGHVIRALEVFETETLATGTDEDATRLVVRGTQDRTATRTSGQADTRGGSGRHGVRLALALLAVILVAGIGVYLALDPRDEPTGADLLDRLPAESPDRPRTAIQYERLAIEHFQKAQYEQSLEIARLGLSITPDDARLAALKALILDQIEVGKQMARARDLLRQNLLDESLSLVESGLKRLPAHPELLALRDELHARIDERTGRQAETLLESARASLDSGQLEDAMKKVDQGLELVPVHAGLTALRASVQEAIDQRQGVQDSIRRASELLASGSVSESLAFIDKALESAPNDGQLLDLRETARKQLQQERERRVKTFLEQARDEKEQNRFKQSLGLIDEGLRLDPDHQDLRILRGEVMAARDRARQEQTGETLKRAQDLFDRQDFAASLDLTDKGLAVSPDHPGLTQLRDRIAALRETKDRITALLSGCGNTFPLDGLPPDASIAAAACYTQVLRLEPANVEALDRIRTIGARLADSVESLLKTHQLDAAETGLGQLQAIAPENPRLAALREDLKLRRERAPRMIPITGGCFQMGSPATEPGREDDERQHQVCVKAFRLGQFEVSVEEFARFVKTSNYRTDAEKGVGGMAGCWSLDQEDKANAWAYRSWANWREPNKYQPTRDRDPISCVSWNDTQAYLRWLNGETGGEFRLPTEAEWEYAARAGSTTARHWGDTLDDRACRHANSADAGHGWADGFPCNDNQEWVAPIGSFEPNAWGLSDPLGNLWEWTCSEYDAAYSGAEQVCAPSGSDAPRILRGGAWNSGPGPVRSAYRNRNFPESRYSFVGFRVARDGPADGGGTSP